jgi:hypothetical protein
MEPFDATLRARLIAADPDHSPSVINARIDTLIGLLSRRSQIDSYTHPDHATALDVQIDEVTATIAGYRTILFGESGKQPK